MKILFIGETPRLPTGFGQQARFFSEAMTERGHEVVHLSYAALSDASLPAGVSEICYPVEKIQDYVTEVSQRVRPDVIVMLRDLYGAFRVLERNLDLIANTPMRVWFAYEGARVPSGNAREFCKSIPANTLVHLSNAARDMWDAFTKSSLVIPHAVDSTIFRPLESKEGLRQKWSMRLNSYIAEDSFLLLCTERNDSRKRWDSVFQVANHLVYDYGMNVQLLAHTLLKTVPGGMPAHYDLEVLADFYKLRGRVITTNFVWQSGLSRLELNELYNMADCRISCATGEGFGLGAIEASAAKCPQIVNGYQCAAELFPSPTLTEGRNSVVESNEYFFDRDTFWVTPHTREMADRIANKVPQQQVDANYAFVMDKFSKETVATAWEDELLSLVGRPRISVKRAALQQAYASTLLMCAKKVAKDDLQKLLYVIRSSDEWEMVRVAGYYGHPFSVLPFCPIPDDCKYLSFVKEDFTDIFDITILGTKWLSNFDWSALTKLLRGKSHFYLMASVTDLWNDSLMSSDAFEALWNEVNVKLRVDINKECEKDANFRFLHHKVWQSMDISRGHLISTGFPDAVTESEF